MAQQDEIQAAITLGAILFGVILAGILFFIIGVRI